MESDATRLVLICAAQKIGLFCDFFGLRFLFCFEWQATHDAKEGQAIGITKIVTLWNELMNETWLQIRFNGLEAIGRKGIQLLMSWHLTNTVPHLVHFYLLVMS